MKRSRQLCSAIVLTLALVMSALAGETHTPPCAPGETASPPCESMVESPGPSFTAPEDAEPSMLDILLFALQSALVDYTY
jgi:hypothetical protein